MSTKYYERRAQQIVQEAKSKKIPSDPTRDDTEAPLKASEDVLEAPESLPKGLGLAKVIQLLLWPEPNRAAPNVLLRSALFSVVEKGKRKKLDRELVASWPGTEIRFKGDQLDQFDETVWFQVVHLAAIQALDNRFAQFKIGPFLRALGLTKTGSALKRIDESFTRMIACQVDIDSQGFQYRDNILGLQHEKATGVYTVRLNPKLVQLFQQGFTRVEWQTRLALKTELAKWLHSFVLTHRAAEGHPQRTPLVTLKQLSGTRVERKLFHFRSDVRSAMGQLKELGVVKSWRITENDSLEFMRQRRKELQQHPSSP